MNEKNKLIIVGALGAVFLAVGAFQFMAPPPKLADDTGSTTAKGGAAHDSSASAAGKAEPAKEDPQAKLREFLSRLADTSATPRDPFVPTGELLAEYQNSPSKYVATPPAPPKQESRPRPSYQEPIQPMRPFPGELRPIAPPGQGLAGPLAAAPAGPGPQNAQDSGYKVKGVIVGTRRMVVLEDSAGNQKLVPEGSSVDGDTTVVGIQDGRVQLRHRGRKTEVRLQEDDR